MILAQAVAIIAVWRKIWEQVLRREAEEQTGSKNNPWLRMVQNRRERQRGEIIPSKGERDQDEEWSEDRAADLSVIILINAVQRSMVAFLQLLSTKRCSKLKRSRMALRIVNGFSGRLGKLSGRRGDGYR
jgi:hypothetical protein